MYQIKSICKGGGYMYCRTNPIHPKANSKGLYPLHRVLMENKIGRNLLTTEHVHHKDENKYNNHIDNLELLTVSDHAKLHRPVLASINIQCKCGTYFEEKPHIVRRKLKKNKTGLYCSRYCAGKYANN